MRRSVIHLAVIVLLSVRSFTETPFVPSIDTDLASEHGGASIRAGRPSQQAKETSISIARLRVPAKARKLFEKSRKALLKHRYSVAEQNLTQALQHHPDFPEALTMLGYIQLDRGEWGAAEHNLRAAVRSDATYGLAYLVFSDLCNRQGHFDEALDMARRGQALLPDTWSVQYEMVRAFMGKGQFTLALQTSDDGLSRYRGTLLHVARAHALIGLRRYSEAVAELRVYLAYEPNGDGAENAHALLKEIQGF
jgi:tetratricopeptide (TPR) repeat protein